MHRAKVGQPHSAIQSFGIRRSGLHSASIPRLCGHIFPLTIAKTRMVLEEVTGAGSVRPRTGCVRVLVFLVQSGILDH